MKESGSRRRTSPAISEETRSYPRFSRYISSVYAYTGSFELPNTSAVSELLPTAVAVSDLRYITN